MLAAVHLALPGRSVRYLDMVKIRTFEGGKYGTSAMESYIDCSLLCGGDSSTKSHTTAIATDSNLDMALPDPDGDNLMTNAKLVHRLQVVEESKGFTALKNVVDRLDNVIRMVNTHENDNRHVQQMMQDMQQVVETLKQTIDSWNKEYYPRQEQQTR